MTHIKGTDNVTKAINRLFDGAKEHMHDAVSKAAELTAEKTETLCKNDDVRKSISIEMQDENSLTVKAAGAEAVRTEFGSEDNPPSPFIIPALKQSTEETQKYLEKIFQ